MYTTVRPWMGACFITVMFAGGGCVQKPPDEVVLAVPFTSQAPVGDWSEPWQNACEEASMYMVDRFYTDNDITPEQAVQDMEVLFAQKREHLSESRDESLATIANMVEKLDLPFATEVRYDPTVEDLKKALIKKRPIIVPVYAPLLGFLEGIDYHVLVLVGYDEQTREFIANDPGSASGRNIRYPYDTFMNAIHDLHPQEYTAGKKAVLFTKPKYL